MRGHYDGGGWGILCVKERAWRLAVKVVKGERGRDGPGGGWWVVGRIG